jgi:hypothetical protein
MIITSNSKVVVPYGTTVEQLIKILSVLPKDAKVSIFKDKYYDQRDPGQAGIDVTWRTEV